jgi:hypothetical protein
MNIKNKYSVQVIKKEETYEWILYKHYAKRIPPISYAFGLHDDEMLLKGICTFGIPASGFKLSIQPYELNRLVINDNLPRNTGSFFVSHCLNNFPEDSIIVSYADSNQNHHGYIYQSTNWLYTGEIDCRVEYVICGRKTHCKTFYNKYGTSSFDKLKKEYGLDIIKSREAKPKHRYFFIVGEKKFKEEKKTELLKKYKTFPYPKGDNKRYDASYKPAVQKRLF